jgi:hypothetical protein
VFPNPALQNTSLTITVPESGQYKLSVSVVTGRIFYSELLTAPESGIIKTNTSEVFRNSGVYHLSLSRPDEIYNHKVLIK